MKAKEHAAVIIASPEDPSNMVDQLEVIALEAIDTAKSRFSLPSMVGALRDGFSKWKSVVSQVEGAIPGYPIHIGLFPKLVAAVNPVLFKAAVDANTFLGYELDAKDRAGAEVGRQIVENEMLRERLAFLQKEMQRMSMRG